MKNIFFYVIFLHGYFIYSVWGRWENDENLPTDNGNTEKPKDDESQELVLSITPIGD